MQLKDLKSNPKNPRKIGDNRLKALQKSLLKFGDLSGIVYNIRTKALVSGHQRKKGLPPDAKVKIEQKYDKPTRCFTVAEGYIEIEGERFKYREVDASPEWEAEALLAANKHGGQWDNELLRLHFLENPKLNIELSGFNIDEIKSLNINLPQVQNNKAQKNDNGQQQAENTKQVQEKTKSAFENIDEKTELEKRHIIIIDCQSEQHKKKLKDQIKAVVEKSGAKFF